ncbi:hypothetical protein BB050_03567 [Flavobacterium anhuiense]|uniref:Uncharacterized protein n=1 Tax=Flavobacterium anhuiense TaxID=459526 RepID=A0AAC9D4N7_9FLAO|nr:hypothetical protein BB050_03567 [Flavobacterium anhuiense]
MTDWSYMQILFYFLFKNLMVWGVISNMIGL